MYRTPWIAIIGSGVLGGLVGAALRTSPANAGETPVVTSPPRIITAQAFILTDKSGQPRGSWRLVDGEPALALTDEKGIGRLLIGLVGHEPMVVICDADSRPRAQLLINSHGWAGLACNDGQHIERLVVGSGKDGTAGIWLEEGEKKVVASMIRSADVNGLVFFDHAGKPVWMAP